MILSILIYYAIIINALTFACYGIDKYKAQKHQWRIPEKTLIMLAVAGGAIGALLGIRFFHHKTMHKKFKYGIPIILFFQMLLAICLVYSVFHLH